MREISRFCTFEGCVFRQRFAADTLDSIGKKSGPKARLQRLCESGYPPLQEIVRRLR